MLVGFINKQLIDSHLVGSDQTPLASQLSAHTSQTDTDQDEEHQAGM